MGFLFIDFGKIEDERGHKRLVFNLIQRMDTWIRNFENDGTPPNEEEAAVLESDKITEIMQAYEEESQKFPKAAHKFDSRREKMSVKLDARRGKLYRKFSDDVEELKDLAEQVVKDALEEFEEFCSDLEDLDRPLSAKNVDERFDEFDETMRAFVDMNYPEGVTGIDSYDDELPMTWEDFGKLQQEKRAETQAKNEERRKTAKDEARKGIVTDFRSKVNGAIKSIMDEMESELTELTTEKLPYLNDSELSEFRDELIAQANDYKNSRLESEEEEG